MHSAESQQSVDQMGSSGASGFSERRCHRGHTDLRRGGHTRRPGNVLGARAAAVLLGSAPDERCESASAIDRQCPDAARSPELVPGDRDQLGAEAGDGNLSSRLDRVDVQGNAGFPRDRRDLLDRLNSAGLVVRVHHRDQCRARPQRRGDVIGGDVAGGPGIDECHLDTHFLEGTGVLENRRVLDRGRDQMPGEIPRREGAP